MFHGFRKSKKGHSIEIEDISIDSVIQKNYKNSILASQKRETTIGERAFVGLFISFFLCLLLILCISFFYQVINPNSFLVKAEKNRYIFKEINTQRGIIYDRNFNELVENKLMFNLVLEGEATEKSIKQISDILNLDFEKLKKDISENEEEKMYLLKNLTNEQVIVLKTNINDLTGFALEKKSLRGYKDGEIFSHVIGYVALDEEIGKDGIEKQYEEILKENKGVIKYERDALDNILSEELVKDPESGKSLILNIDKDLQIKSAEVLETAVFEAGGNGGAVIIMNPNTGEIQTLVSYPSYDNNFFSSNFTSKEYETLLSQKNVSFFNRAISGGYPIGSTIKPMLATAFLEEDIIDAETNINCQGGIELSDGTFKSDWTTHGLTNVRKAIAESCDVYFYILGGGYKNIKGLGIEKISAYLYKYGFGKKTGIDLPSENSGFVGDSIWKEESLGKVWYPGDTYNISIGQGYIKATPLQVLVAISAIANGGKIVKPQIVQGIVDDNKNIIQTFAPEIISENFISSENLKVVQEGMRQTVTSASGSAPSFNALPISLAAKSGTAETGSGTYHNWMVVYGPYEDPDMAMIVLVENVSSFGGITQGVVREIVNYYYEKNIDKDSNN
ncbi:MAG: penicillin-binding protein 2 [Candidatus Pacebacteria bacterium]|nr:penicillin-binding protein 2 [Candidatus Paceibacterota bacterium]